MYIFFVLCKSILSRAQLKHPASMHACQLTHCCVVRVEGEEGRRFLQGMVTADMEQERETGSTFYSMMMNAQVRQELRGREARREGGREGGREEGEREEGREGGREGGREEVSPGNGHGRHGAGERDWEYILFNDDECSSETRVEREGGREGRGREGERGVGGREGGGSSREWSQWTWSRRERLGVHSIQCSSETELGGREEGEREEGGREGGRKGESEGGRGEGGRERGEREGGGKEEVGGRRELKRVGGNIPGKHKLDVY